MEVITINPVTYKITESKIKSSITLRYRAIGSATIQNTQFIDLQIKKIL